MPGFIYSPFYTTNLFTDPTLNGYQMALRPEDRVIEVNKERIDQLDTAVVRNAKVYLVYELVHALVGIRVPVQNWTINRMLEKASPLFLSGILLLWLNVRWLLAVQLVPVKAGAENDPPDNTDGSRSQPRRENEKWLILSGVLAGLALLTAPDYFLAPGAGLNSGFDPVARWQAGEVLALTSKWSAYLYYPLWTLAAAACGVFQLKQLITKIRWQRWFMGIVGGLVTFDLADYIYAAYLTYRYNNPDYFVWHVRGEFWLLWPLLLILVWVNIFMSENTSLKNYGTPSNFKPNLIAGICFSLFVVTFIVPTVFDWSLPGFGVQWWSFLAIPYFYQMYQKGKNR